MSSDEVTTAEPPARIPLGPPAYTRVPRRAPLLLFVVMCFSWVLVTAVWTVVGLYLWFPAILLAIISYVASVSAAAYSGNAALLNRVEHFLETAVTLYPRGFQRIYWAVFRPRGEDDEEAGAKPLWEPLLKLLVRGFFTFLIATVVWYLALGVILFITGKLVLSK